MEFFSPAMRIYFIIHRVDEIHSYIKRHCGEIQLELKELYYLRDLKQRLSCIVKKDLENTISLLYSGLRDLKARLKLIEKKNIKINVTPFHRIYTLNRKYSKKNEIQKLPGFHFYIVLKNLIPVLYQTESEIITNSNTDDLLRKIKNSVMSAAENLSPYSSQKEPEKKEAENSEEKIKIVITAKDLPHEIPRKLEDLKKALTVYTFLTEKEKQDRFYELVTACVKELEKLKEQIV